MKKPKNQAAKPPYWVDPSIDTMANRYRHRLPIVSEPGVNGQRHRYFLGSVLSRPVPLTARQLESAVKAILRIEGVAKVEVLPCAP